MTYEQRICQELERVCGTDEWIRIHCDAEDPDAFEVVSVVRIGLNTIFAQAIDTRGRPDGSRSIALASIVGATIGGYYLQNLRALCDALPAKVHVQVDGDGHEGTLRAAQESHLVVSIRMSEETVQGHVREVGEGWTAIAQIQEEEGGDDGVRIVSLREAEHVFIGGRDEMRLATLFQARQTRDSVR